MQTEFIRSLNSNYERILLDGKPDEKRYQYCILGRGGIRGLLECSLRYINGLAYLYYDISSKQNIMQLYNGKSITREWIRDFLCSVKQIRFELERFLLDENNLLWFPDQVFQDLERNEFTYLYIPYYEGENGMKQMMEYWVERIDYNDELLVECVYSMYEKFEKMGPAYWQSQIFEDAARLDEEVIAEDESREEENQTLDYIPIVDDEARTKKQTTVPRRRIFGVFDERRKRNREIRENYKQSIHEAMYGCAVAEESDYEEFGKTIYIEERQNEENSKRLYDADGRPMYTIDKPEVIIGKKKDNADIVIEDPSISRIHARITEKENTYTIEDLNSTNGTFKNGLRLQPYEKRELEKGDEIRMGRITFTFR